MGKARQTGRSLCRYKCENAWKRILKRIALTPTRRARANLQTKTGMWILDSQINHKTYNINENPNQPIWDVKKIPKHRPPLPWTLELWSSRLIAGTKNFKKNKKNKENKETKKQNILGEIINLQFSFIIVGHGISLNPSKIVRQIPWSTFSASAPYTMNIIFILLCSACFLY